MTRDLIDLMHDDVAARERSIAGIEPSATALADVARQVRRRRTVRRTLQVGGAGVAVVVLGAASWFGLQDRRPPVPAQTPTPSVSASPTPSPSASVVLDELPGLPPTQALPAGLLESTTPGWVLTVYRSELPAADHQGPSSLVHTVVLVSPAGERYRVVDLPLDTSLSLLRWDAGSTTAVVSVEYAGDFGVGRVPRADLDLLSGTLTPTPVDLGEHGGGPFYLGVTADGAELWSTATSTDAATSDVFRRTADGDLELVGAIGSSTPVLDPTRTRLAADIWTVDDRFAVIDVVDGGRTEHAYGVPGRRCTVVGWLDADSLLTSCTEALEPDLVDGEVTLHRVEVSGASTPVTEVARFAADEPLPTGWSGAGLADGRVAFTVRERGLGGCATGASVWDGERVVPLDDVPGGTVDVGVGDGVVYVEATSSCHEARPADLTAYSLTAGTSVLLAPAPTATDGGVEWVVGLRSWAVADAPVPTR